MKKCKVPFSGFYLSHKNGKNTAFSSDDTLANPLKQMHASSHAVIARTNWEMGSNHGAKTAEIPSNDCRTAPKLKQWFSFKSGYAGLVFILRENLIPQKKLTQSGPWNAHNIISDVPEVKKKKKGPKICDGVGKRKEKWKSPKQEVGDFYQTWEVLLCPHTGASVACITVAFMPQGQYWVSIKGRVTPASSPSHGGHLQLTDTSHAHADQLFSPSQISTGVKKD